MDNIGNSVNDDSLFEDDNNSPIDEDYCNGYAVESVRDPANAMEWEEAVITEFIWQTGRTLPTATPKMKQSFRILMDKGYSPSEASDFFIEKMQVDKIESNDEWEI